MPSVKPEKPPSLLGVYLIGCIMAWFGGLLGFIYLATFSPKAFADMVEYAVAHEEKETPEFSKPGDSFYIKGPILTSRSWETKRALLNESGPQTISLSVGEMNAWMDSRFSAALSSPERKQTNFVVIPGVPNFAVVEEQGFYVNLPLSIVIFGKKYDCVLIALGSVTTGGFEPHSVSLNSAALPLPKIVGSRVLQSLAQAFQSTEDYGIVTRAIERAESIKMERNALVLSLR